jgi:hypothetical protein
MVGSYSHDAGWIDRVVIAPGEFPLNNGATRGNVLAAPVATDYHDVNDVTRTTVRVSALIKPVDGVSIAPALLYQKLDAGGLPYIDSTPGGAGRHRCGFGHRIQPDASAQRGAADRLGGQRQIEVAGRLFLRGFPLGLEHRIPIGKRCGGVQRPDGEHHPHPTASR